MKLKKTIVLCLFLLLMVSVHGQIIYVKTNVTGNGNGTSWANAYTSLQPALAAATSGKQIWVAKGTYKPTTGTDRTVSFQMKNGVKIYGGFAGTETSIGQRANYGSGEANETILSGDIGTAEVSTDNSYHVISNSGIDSTALLDGFTITGGQADNYSEQNPVPAEGGGILNSNSSPVINQCCFIGNYAYFGGGILNFECSPKITNCTFESDSALHQGGAIFNYHTLLTLTGCTFTGNRANEGGAICNFVNNSLFIEHSSFFNNTGESGGGIYNYQSNPSVDGCVFEGNDVGNEYGGAIYNYESSPTYNGCIFRKNHAKYGGGIYNGMNSSAVIQNCLFVKNSAEYGGGIENFRSSPGIVNCTFYGNFIDNYLGGAAVGNDEESAPVIKNSIFQDNYRTSDDSLVNIYDGDLEKVTYCSFYLDHIIYPGEGNIYYYAAFTDTSGIDGITGTDDDDFSLKKKSPCIGVGTATGAPTTDIRGLTRGTPPDLGAYENELDVPKYKIIYVKAGATGKNDGTSWTDAYTSLLPALNEATNYDQVWVARGIYKPTTGTDRSISFSMKKMVKIVGGFAGTEAELSFRKNYGPGEANETILSGNIGNEADRNDNSYHVFYHPEGLLLDSISILDGFTISDGNASGSNADKWETDEWNTYEWETFYGGGMYNYNSSPTIRNCFFTNNSASSGGGGMYNEYYSSLKISNCIFYDNIAYGLYDFKLWINDGGGGIFCWDHSPITISHCRFENDSAYVPGWSWISNSGGGGGILCDYNSDAHIDNCYFGSNFAEYNGNGIAVNDNSLTLFSSIFEGSGSDITSGKASLTNCLFFNESGIAAGKSRIINCTFYNKTGTALTTTEGELKNAVFWGNNNIINSTGTISALNCCIQGGGSRFPGNNNNYTNPLFADAAHGDFHLSAGSPCISKGLNPAENNLVPLTDLDGNSRPLGSKTDMGAYECRDDGTYPKATTFVISNEAPGYLIDNLIAQSYGDSCLYAVMKYLQPLSGGAIPQWFMDALAACPVGSEIFTAELSNFEGLNNPVGVNSDGTLMITSIYGKDYYSKEGYINTPEKRIGYDQRIFTSASDARYLIDSGSSQDFDGIKTTKNYMVFAIAWSLEVPTTFVLSNEGGLIDNLIAAGYGNSNLYEVLVALQPSSGGIISDEFMASLAHCPAGSEIFNATLSNFAELNNPVCINSDGTFGIQPIFGKDFYQEEGYKTYPEELLVGVKELFTYPTNTDYYIDAGEGPNGRYKAFAIAWSQEQTPTLSVSTNTLNVAAANGSTASFNVTSNISWSVASDQSWLSVNPASGTGNGTITVTAQTNPEAATRTATVTVSGSGVTSQTVTVTQLEGAPTLSVSTNTLNVSSANGSTASFNVTSNINWTVSSDQSWLTVSPVSGTGNGTVTVTAEANPTAATRTATITVSGSGVTSQTVTVTQLAGASTLSVSTNTLNVASANGSTASFNITSNINWTVASDQSWLTVNPANGSGNGTINVTAEANLTVSTRIATVTVSGTGVTSQTVTVTQITGEPTLSVSTNNLKMPATEGSTATFDVISNVSWLVASDQSWLTPDIANGTGNGTVTLTAGKNESINERTATITVSATGTASQTVTVTQKEGEATLSVSTSTLDIEAAEGSIATFSVISNTNWTVAIDQTWLTANPSSGTGNTTVTLTATANPNDDAYRVATVTVAATGAASQSVEVVQDVTVGVSENALNDKSVYPNPFTSGFYVNPDGINTTVLIYDLRGREIYTRIISKTEYFSFDGMLNGVYLIELKSGQTTFSKKLIKR